MDWNIKGREQGGKELVGHRGETRMERAGNQDSRVISEEGRYRVKDEKWVLCGPALNESAAFYLIMVNTYSTLFGGKPVEALIIKGKTSFATKRRSAELLAYIFSSKGCPHVLLQPVSHKIVLITF